MSALKEIIVGIFNCQNGCHHDFDLHISNDIIQLKCDSQVIITENDLSKLLSENYYIYISPKDVSIKIENGLLYGSIVFSGVFDKKVISQKAEKWIEEGFVRDASPFIMWAISQKIKSKLKKKTGTRIDVQINKLKLEVNNKNQYQLDMLVADISIKERKLTELFNFLTDVVNKKLFVNPRFQIEEFNLSAVSVDGKCNLCLKTNCKIDCT